MRSWTHKPSTTTRRRMAGTLAAVAVLAGAVVPLFGSADAQAATAGPINPATGIPTFFTDSTGVSLRPQGTNPAVYFSAAASLPTAGPGATTGNSTMLAALEALNPATVIQRFQFNIAVPGPGSYFVTDPYHGSSQLFTPSRSWPPTACRPPSSPSRVRSPRR